MELSLILILFFFGIVGGFISGLLGVGGGIIFVPVLSSILVVLGLEDPDLAKYILANSFAATFFAGAISSYKQFKLKSFYPKEIGLTAMIAIPLSLATTYLIAQGSWYDKKSFSIFFILLLLLMLYRFLFFKPKAAENAQKTKPSKLGITGGLTGIISALSGLGGGVIMVPLFTQYLKFDIKKAAAVSIGVIPTMMIPMIIAYGIQSPQQLLGGSQVGYLLPEVFLPLVAGLLFAAPVGVSVGQKASNKFLKIIFASLIVIVILKTIASTFF